MKTKLLILVIAVGFISSANAQIKVFSNGKVGINKDSVTHDLEVFGNTYFNVSASYSWVGAMIDGSYEISGPGSFATLYSVNGMGVLGKPTAPWYYIYYNNLQQLSDSKIKKNVSNIESPLSGIKKLRPVKYDLNEKAFQGVPDSLKANLMENNKDKFGFIAQELKEVFPTLVNYDKKSDLYSINYVELIPVLVGALNEQQSQIDSLKELLSSDLPIKSKSASKSADIENIVIDSTKQASLYQNAPNPFSSETKISYYLPESAINAHLCVYDLNGQQIRSIKLLERGAQTETFKHNDLKAGIYLYSLLIDGKEIDCMRMVITE